ncbi:MAG: tetratricopeptide repeat protein [Bryobacteraceae bacterium]|nr:tetratricopeptide repeat protein [Bryobacteraceae bacterium]
MTALCIIVVLINILFTVTPVDSYVSMLFNKMDAEYWRTSTPKTPATEYFEAMSLKSAGNNAEAEAILKRILVDSPDFLSAYYSLSEMLYDRGRTVEADNLLDLLSERCASLPRGKRQMWQRTIRDLRVRHNRAAAS